MNKEIMAKLSKFALVSAIVGVCTLGVCPAFGIMGIVVGIVFKVKGVELDALCKKKIKTAYILGGISLVLFVADIVLASVFLV